MWVQQLRVGGQAEPIEETVLSLGQFRFTVEISSKLLRLSLMRGSSSLVYFFTSLID